MRRRSAPGSPAATEAMLEMAGVKPGARVLDVAAGAGEQTLLVAERVGPTGSVLATDLSPAIVALAQANAERAGHRNVRTQVADGESLGLAPASFDAAVCRLGLDVLPEPAAGPAGNAPRASPRRRCLHDGVLATRAQPLHHDPDVDRAQARRPRTARPISSRAVC